MAQPSPREFQPYRHVQGAAEKELRQVLEATAKLIQKRIAGIRPGVGGVVRAAQLRLVLAAIKRLQRQMWTNGITPAIQREIDAALEAGESAVEALTRVAYTALNDDAAEELVKGLKAAAESGLKSDAARKKRDLSQRVYKLRALHEGKVEEIVRAGLIAGLSAKELASEAYQYVSPTTKGGASYAAMRLARTEINNAFHERQIEGAKRPGVEGVKWNLSGSHKVPDECNVYAEHEPYDPDEIPDKPHPQCFCYLTYVMQPPAEFRAALERGDWDDEIARRTRENMALLGQKVGSIEPNPVAQVKKARVKRTPSGKAQPVETAAKYVPGLDTGTEGGNAAQRVQFMLHQGKTRQQIVESELKRGRPAGEADQAIDRLLIQYGVPNHVMARTGTGTGATPIKKPDAAAVVRKAPPPIAERISQAKPSAPEAKSALRLEVESRIDRTFTVTVTNKIKRVIGIQEEKVGDRIDRVKGFRNGLTNEKQAAYGVFNRAEKVIKLRKDLARHERDVVSANRSGQKSRCGHDGVENTVAHECGHAFIMEQDLTREQLDAILRAISTAFKLPVPMKKNGTGGIAAKIDVIQWQKDPRNRAAIEKLVGKYATSNINEMFAEIWADYTMNPNPSPEVRKAGNALQSMIRELPR